MKNDQKFLIGILGLIFSVAIFANKANAISSENNLSKQPAVKTSTAQAVFLVSKPSSLKKVDKNLDPMHV